MKISELSKKKVILAPYNDLSIKLRNTLPEDIYFAGFVDNFKSEDGVFSSKNLPKHEVVIINSPNHWRKIAAAFDTSKVYLYNMLGYEIISYDEYIKFVEEEQFFDVLLLPSNKSNIYDLSIIARELKKLNISSAIIDISSNINKNFKEGLEENNDIQTVHKDQVDYTKRKAILSSTDWQVGFCHPFLKKARENGELTIGIVDGIEDFEDADYLYQRNAYETVEFVLLMGKDDQNHLKHKVEKTSIVGLPKMWSLVNERSSLPRNDRVMINVNFTYGSFEEVREEWVNDVMSACQSAELPFIISQHHADNGSFPTEVVSTKNVYDTINDTSIVVSRFSTVILESLAMGRQVIYFNPHGETVKLYADPEGAYQIAKTIPELINCLKIAKNDRSYGKNEARQFLERKCNISSTIPPGKLAAYRVKNLIEERELICLTPEYKYEMDERYCARQVYHQYDIQSHEDEWRLEVYLHALGLMVKNRFTSIADVGCGSGFKLMTYFKDYSTLGLELPKNVNVLKEKYPDKNWKVFDFSSQVQEISTDVIICSDVIEQIVNPDELLSYLDRQSFEYLILSTSARDLVYSKDDPAMFGPPKNLTHQREWNFEEFQSYLSKFFDVIDHRITNYHQATQMMICKKKRK